MPSHQLAQIQFEDLDIIGYSVGGEETVVAVPQLDVCFDIGKAPDQLIPINHVLLTHGHMDHAAGIAYYLSHRQFCGQSPGTILAPANLLGPIGQIIEAWGKLDGSRIQANLVGVKAGDEYAIKPNLIARVFPTKHCYGSVGFCLIERRKKLRSEYAGLTGPQIVELKKKGVTIDYPVELPLVTYLGDTNYVDFSSLEYIRDSRILIAECTFFIDEHLDRAEAGRHIHVDDFAKMIEPLRNEQIIITHVTQRTGLGEAQKILRSKLPAEQYGRIRFLMDRKWRKKEES